MKGAMSQATIYRSQEDERCSLSAELQLPENVELNQHWCRNLLVAVCDPTLFVMHDRYLLGYILADMGQPYRVIAVQHHTVASCCCHAKHYKHPRYA